MASQDLGVEAIFDSCDEILDHLLALADIDTVDRAWTVHLACMARYGFDRVFYSFATLPAHRDVLADTLILSNHASSFLDPYLREGWWRRPLFLDHAHDTGLEAVPWRVTPEMRPTEEQRRALQFQTIHGVTAGMTLNLRRLTPQGRAGIGLCARPGLDQDAVDAIWQAHGRRLMLLNMAFHLRVVTLPIPMASRTLSRRQAEALYWSSDGKSVQDIATLMGVRPATVEKHLRLARAALGVQTTAQAVLRAGLLNQLVPPATGHRQR
ncbi:MAG: helix-turn-helix transcriptional regulator [Alkalilacustris sp.]